jgi:YD repeat-containing protein
MFGAARSRLVSLPQISIVALALLGWTDVSGSERVQKTTDKNACPVPGTCSDNVEPFSISYTLESIDPFTSTPQAMPRAITLPRNTVVTFGAAAKGVHGALRFIWEGARESRRSDISSIAEGSFEKQGTYTVTVTPERREHGGPPEILSHFKRTISIVVTRAAAQSIHVRIENRETPGPIPVGKQITCHGSTSPRGYEHLIQWSGGGEPQRGLGPVFTTKYRTHGSYRVTAGRRSFMDIKVYGIRAVRHESSIGSAILYGIPVTFYAETAPAGYSHLVSWNVETMHDMFTRAMPAAGHGAAFTTQFQPSSSNGRFWAQIYADSYPTLLAPDVPQSLSGQALIPSPDQLSKRIEELAYGDPRDSDTETNVQLSNGQFYLRVVDLSIPGRGMDFRFERAYRSRIEYNGPLGFGWDFNYNIRLMDELNVDGTATGHIYFFNGLGRRDRFVRLGDGSYLSPPGYYARLSKDPATGLLTLRERDGTVYAFTIMTPSTHRASITSITDRNQNRMLFTHDAIGNLSRVTDTMGRQVDFEFGMDGRLVSFRDFTGRVVAFGYDEAKGDLTSVTSPAIPAGSTPNGNDFPSGKTTRYTYASGFANAALNHNLISIVRPNEVAVSGPPFVLNTYGTDAANLEEFDRILQQDRGGTNVAASSRGLPPAGGLSRLYYQSLNPSGDPNDLLLPRSRTTIVDPIGNVAAYEQNVQGGTLIYKEYTGRVNSTLSRVVLQGLIPSNNPSFPPIPRLRLSDPSHYATTYEYNAAGEMVALHCAAANLIQYTYDVSNPDPIQAGNLLRIRSVPAPSVPSGQAELITTLSYEPIYNRIRSICDPRGNDPLFQPPIDPGQTGCDRYARSRTFDYEEGCNIAAISARIGRSVPATQALLNNAGMCVSALGDVNGDGQVGQINGNSIRSTDPTVHLLPGSRQAVLTGSTLQPAQEILWLNDLGQVRRRIDSEGNGFEYSYYPETDPDGDGLDINPAPGLNPTTGGYLRMRISDTTANAGRNNGTNPTPTQIHDEFLWDRVGNRTGWIDGRGILTRWIFNALSQIVETRRAVATADQAGPFGDSATGRGEAGLTPEAIRSRQFYDHNDNLVRYQTEDIGATRGLGSFVDSTWAHDILDAPIEATHDLTPSSEAKYAFLYDANGNLVQKTEPELNVDQWSFDERDLMFDWTRGAAGPRGGVPSTRSFRYDENRLGAGVTDGRGGVIDFLYDGFSRLRQTVDQSGHTVEVTYDPADHITRVLRRGSAGGPPPSDRGGSTNVDLMDTSFSYDERSRPTEINRRLFVPQGTIPLRAPGIAEGPLTPNDGYVTTRLEYDRLGRRTFVTRDSGVTFRWDFDGVGRPLRQTDSAQSTLEWTYDANHNGVELVEIEVPSASGPPAETFITTAFYDALDRTNLVVDPAGQARRWSYDSLGAVTARSDANGPPAGSMARRSTAHAGEMVPINGHGNVSRMSYDGLSREIQSEIVLTSSGGGNGTPNPVPDTSNSANPDGLITTSTVWDRNSQVSSRQDDKGGVSSNMYDNLGRLVSRTAPDGTVVQYSYDQEGNVESITDANGTLIENTFDPTNHLIGRDITPAAGVTGTTNQSFEVDGLGRVTRATDNNGPGASDDVTSMVIYDSLGRVLEERQDAFSGSFSTDTTWAAEDCVTSIIYPSGMTIESTFDSADRVILMEDPSRSEWASFEYFGATRLHTRRFGNGIRSTRLDDSGVVDTGFDLSRRTTRLRHLTPANALLAGYEHLYDREGNQVAVRRLHDPGVAGTFRGERNVYDSQNRVRSFVTGLLDASGGLVGSPVDSIAWTLDGPGNVREFVRNGISYQNTPNINNEYDDPQSGGTRVDDGLPDDLRDDLSTPAPDGVNLRHDKNGNETRNGAFAVSYDFRNRPVSLSRISDGVQVAAYHYDAHDRRVERLRVNSGPLNEVQRYFYGGAPVAQLIETRDETLQVTRQVVYGVDGRARLWQVTGSSSSQYFLEDARNSTGAIADGASPTILERVIYDPYGVPYFQNPGNAILLDPNGRFLPESQYGVKELYRGMYYDPEFGTRSQSVNTDIGGMYFDGGRHWTTSEGRTTTRGGSFIWAPRVGAGNAYLARSSARAQRSFLGTIYSPVADPMENVPNFDALMSSVAPFEVHASIVLEDQLEKTFKEISKTYNKLLDLLLGWKDEEFRLRFPKTDKESVLRDLREKIQKIDKILKILKAGGDANLDEDPIVFIRGIIGLLKELLGGIPGLPKPGGGSQIVLDIVKTYLDAVDSTLALLGRTSLQSIDLRTIIRSCYQAETIEVKIEWIIDAFKKTHPDATEEEIEALRLRLQTMDLSENAATPQK